MTWEYQAEQAEKHIVNHLVDGRPFLQNVMSDEQAEHKRKPAIDDNSFVLIAKKSESKADLNERDRREIEIHKSSGEPNSQVTLKQYRVVLQESTRAEKLTRPRRQQNNDHRNANDPLCIA